MTRRMTYMAVVITLLLCGCSQPAGDVQSQVSGQFTAIGDFDDTQGNSRAAASDDASAEALPMGKEDVLSLGDPAPALNIAGWFRGDPVEQLEEGSVYVVEFWATWCGPCKMTMPYISELQSEYGEQVTFIGVTDEDEPTVAAFFEAKHPVEPDKTWDDIVTYTIALDEGRATARAFMEAAQQPGIPTAFIVGSTGLIEWIGHPMGVAEPLREILAGTWDVKAAREALEAAQRVEREMQSLGMKFQQAVEASDNEQALEMLDEMTKIMPENPQIGIDRFQVLLQLDRTDEAYEAIDSVVESLWDHADFLEYLAVSIADELPEKQRRLDVAQRVAERAVELTNDATPGALDALARVHFRNGDLDKAIELQEQAVEAGGQAEGDFKDRLESYLEAAEPEPG